MESNNNFNFQRQNTNTNTNTHYNEWKIEYDAQIELDDEL